MKKEPRYKTMYNFMLGVAYFEKADFIKSYNKLKSIKNIAYLDDYIKYYSGVAACRQFNNLEVLEKSIDDLYSVISRGRGHVVDKVKKDIASCEFKLAKIYALNKNLFKSLNYFVRAKDRKYSDLESEFGVIREYFKLDKKFTYSLLLDLHKKYGAERIKPYFDLLPVSVRSDIFSLTEPTVFERKSRNLDSHLEESHLIDTILLAYNEKDYSKFIDTSEIYLIKYPEGIYLKRYYDVVQVKIIELLIKKIRSASSFSKIFKYYNLNKLKKIALNTWKYSDWSNTEYILKLMLERSPNTSDPYYFIASFYEDKKNISEAQNFYEKLVTMFPASRYYSRALFKVSWLDYQNKKYKKCAEGFSKYLAEGGDEFSWDITPALYFSSLCYKKNANEQKSQELLDELIKRYPFSFYSLIARNDKGLSLTKELEELLKKNQNNVGTASGQELVTIQTSLKLLRAALIQDAVNELSKLDFENLSPKYSEIVASIYRYSTSPNLGISFSYKLLNNFKTYLSKAHAENHFPLLYFDIIDLFSKKSGVEAEILISIIRRESAFKIDAVSSAGALGLMQVMPETAKGIEPGVTKSDLIKIEDNIRIASAYLKDLLNKYKGNLIYVLANYNAGEQAVQRWSDWYSRDLSFLDFIESIPVYETRWYVKSVLSNYYMYNALYLKKDIKFNDVVNITLKE